MADNKKFKYENISETEQSLIGVGKIMPGKTVETEEPVYNPNFKLVGGPRMVNVESPVQQPEVKSGIIKGNKK